MTFKGVCLKIGRKVVLMDALKAVCNVLKKVFVFLFNNLFGVFLAILIFCYGVVSFFIAIAYIIGTIILNDGAVYSKLEWISIHIGFLEIIVLVIMFFIEFVCVVRKEKKE